MLRQFSQLIIPLFSFFWIGIIFLDYWYYHQPLIYDSLVNFKYVDILAAISVVGGGLYFFNRNKLKSNPAGLRINGLFLFAVFTLLCLTIIPLHIAKIDIPFTFTSPEVFRYVGFVLGVIMVTYLICVACYSLGDFIYSSLFSLSFGSLDNLLIRLALGITGLCLLLFILGALQLLILPVVGGLLLLLLGVFYKRSWEFIYVSLLKPFSLRDHNALGIASFTYILLFITLGYLQNIRPVPMGFDALAIYLNVPNLIGQQGGLINGYSPYYWSLFSALGHILLDSLPVVLSLAVLGGILSGFCIYAICRKWTNPNYALLAVALFFSLPMTNWQFYRDVKTDLGLLFFMLTVVVVIVNYLKYLYPDRFPKSSILNNKAEKKKITRKKKRKNVKEATVVEQSSTELVKQGWLYNKISIEYQYYILLGILSGTVLGIKLTGLILIFSIIGLFAYLKTGLWGFLSASILFLAIILLGGLDIASGLRAYHFGAVYLKWIALGLGIMGLSYLWLQQKQSVVEVLKYTSVYSAFVLLIYLPWPIKNFVETGQVSISTFIEGKQVGPSKNVNDFIQNANR